MVGSRGAGGFDRLRLGSTGDRTAAHATTPVAVIPPTAEDDVEDPLGLMVSVDGSRAAQRALRWAVDVSMTDVTRVIERGAPADVLVSRTGSGRLLVLGTHGRGAIGRMVFGSVSHQCLHHAAGPVVVVP